MNINVLPFFSSVAFSSNSSNFAPSFLTKKLFSGARFNTPISSNVVVILFGPPITCRKKSELIIQSKIQLIPGVLRRTSNPGKISSVIG